MLRRHESKNSGNNSDTWRPYSGARHGRSAPRASQACASCAAAKVKCDNEKHCRRCARKNISCIRWHPVLGELVSPDSTDVANDKDDTSLPVLSATSVSQPIQNPALHGDFIAPTVAEHQSARIEPQGLEYSYNDHQFMPRNVTSNSVATHFGGDDMMGDIGDTYPIEWDFGSTNDLFALGNDMDFVLSDPDIDFLASIPRLPARSEGDRLASVASDGMSRQSQPASDAVVEAFKQSVGRWSPERQNYRAAAESSLSIATATMDCLGKYDQRAFKQSLTTGLRDQILALIVRSCEHDNMMHIVSCFPGVQVLDRLLKVFFTWQMAQTESWIHVPTFKPNEVRIELLIACIATAAVRSSSRPVQKFGIAIHEFLVFHLWQVSEKTNTLIRDLQFLQAFALHIQMGTWSGIRRKMEMCSSLMNILTNSLRGGDRYRYASYKRHVPQSEDKDEVLEAKWRHWMQEESFKRLVYSLYIHSCQETAMSSGIFLIAYAELSVPLPLIRKLWFAESATEWKSIYLALPATESARSPSVVDLLGDPRRLKSLSMMYDQDLAQHVVVYALCAVCRRYGQDKAVFSSHHQIENREMILSDEAQHRAIKRLLNEVRETCEGKDLTDAPALFIILEGLSMHLHSSIDQNEIVAGKEGPEESQLAYPSLHRWSQTADARLAVWHAGQTLGALRKLGAEQLNNFYAVVAYHAVLCIWIYGVVSSDNKNTSSGSTTKTASSDENPVLIDDEESLQTQRWVSHNRGLPMITGASSSGETGVKWETVSLVSTKEFIDTILKTVMARFAWKNSVLVENICNLMRELGKMVEKNE